MRKILPGMPPVICSIRRSDLRPKPLLEATNNSNVDRLARTHIII